jgi:hypothetical protein
MVAGAWMRLGLVLLLLAVSGHALAGGRPPAPPSDTRARPGQPGWTVEHTSGCWVWNPEPSPDDVMTWSGHCSASGPAEGTGTLEWRYGGGEMDRYEGEYRAGKMDGRGRYSWSNGKQYDGEWKAGQLHGRGRYQWPDGSVYEGEWRHDQRNGRGVLTYANGNRYEGDWVDGLYEGQGTFRWANGDRYEGSWKHGKSEGAGMEVFHTGNRYRGNWKEDQPDGLGEFWVDGRHYAGTWKQGCFKTGGSDMVTGDQIYAIGRPFRECMAVFNYACIDKDGCP